MVIKPYTRSLNGFYIDTQITDQQTTRYGQSRRQGATRSLALFGLFIINLLISLTEP